MRRLRKATFAAGLLPNLIAFAGPSFAVDEQDFTHIERGRYLTIVADCTACHTDPSGKYLAGARPIVTPFGTLLSANITPDRDTGIGNWSSKDFLSALKSGIGHDGKRLYPAMPYTYFTKMPDADVLAIWAYLRTIPPVRNEVETNQLPFPYNLRFSLKFWNWLNFSEGEWKPVPGKSAEWNRGSYLVEGPMHCGACHTPKNLLGGDFDSRRLQGYSIQGWFAPDITNNNRLGIGGWSPEQIIQYLRTGHNDVASASGPMAEEIEQSSQHMTAEDLKAVATYLKDQPAPAKEDRPAAVAASDPLMKAGKAIYGDSCSACHREDGRGIPEMFPALRDAPTVRQKDPISLIRVVVEGAKTAATNGAPTGPGMPSYAWQLNDDQIAAVLTYVRNAWGNAAGAVSKADVEAAKKAFQHTN